MAAPKVHVVVVDPYDARAGLLVPAVTQRIRAFCAQYMDEVDPDAFTRATMVQLWAQNPRLAIVALVNDEGKVVGHAVASIEESGEKVRVFISQCQADGNVGDAVKRAIALADAWGRKHGATHMAMSTQRDDGAWERRYGFKTQRHLMVRMIGDPIEGVTASKGGDT